uniref:RNA-binding protein n=1 Tax=Strongyloides papillosus TaxID=174720 RepID=A0A0N5CFC5_STREA
MANPNYQNRGVKKQSPTFHILRILIPSKYIGSLIGKNGNHPIREIHIASNTKCLVDKNGPFTIFPNLIVKTITFVGDIEGICKACQLVSDFIRNAEEGHGVVHKNYEIFVRFPNQFVGKLIGKKGNNIKKIIEETNSQINVSSDAFIVSIPSTLCRYIPESLSNERTIVVSSDDVSKVMGAIRVISEIRHEMNVNYKEKNIPPYTYGYQFPYQTNNPPNFEADVLRYQGNVYQHQFLNILPTGGQIFQQNNLMNQIKFPVFNTLKIFIPENSVGAVIGTKGSYIKFIISQSGAQIKIESSSEHNRHINEKPKDSKKLSNDANVSSENLSNKKEDALINNNTREVLITGYDPNIQYAQQLIFLKVADATSSHIDKLKLTIEIQIPHGITGKVIGKKGKNVNYLQRITGTKVCVLEETILNNNIKSTLTKVRVNGTLAAISNIQFRLQKIIVDNMNERVKYRQRNNETFIQSQ